MNRPFHEIYRGYDIDYHTDHEEVYIIKNGVLVNTVGGVEAAYYWIDAEKRKVNQNANS